MTQVQLVTDSTTNPPLEAISKYDIKVVSLSYTFEGEHFVEWPQPDRGDYSDFYLRLEKARELPTTSQPPISDFAQVFSRAVEQGKEVLCVTISSALSGTYNSAVQAARAVAPEKIFVVDSKIGSFGVNFALMNAAQRIRQGASAREAAGAMPADFKKMTTEIAISNLECLKKGGRLSNASALIGTALHIAPVVELNNGPILPLKKIRGFKRAVDFMIDRIPENPRRLAVLHSYSPDERKEAAERLRGTFPNADLYISQVSPVVGCHLGSGALGIVVERW